MKQPITRALIFVLVALLALITRMATLLGSRKKTLPDKGIRVVLTGTFYSDNWLITHLRPLAQSRAVNEVIMVAATPVPKIVGVRAVYPSNGMIRILGGTAARQLVFLLEGSRRNVHIVGGFHLLINGLLALMVSQATGKRSLYICGGGERELQGGGYRTENRIFRRLKSPSPLIEKRLLTATRQFDYLVTMGSSVKAFFLRHGAEGKVVIVPGGFDSNYFTPTQIEPEFDVILVGRLTAVKQVDNLIRAIKILGDRKATAVLVGDGPSAESLKKLTSDLKLDGQITFAGWQEDIGQWLQRSRIFVLCSESEGLSQALVQAMLCGLPAVVTNVGDLKDIVSDNHNGFIVHPLAVDELADRIGQLLDDRNRCRQFGQQARQDALHLSVDEVANKWDDIFSGKHS